MIDLRKGDCISKMKEMEDNSIDFILTDPPYELGFMGKKWDNTGIAFSKDLWKEALRVLRPGGYLMAFSGTRTYHRMVVAIEDVGFEVKDMINWTYGSGFPKALDISKALGKKLGVETASSDKAKQYEGYKTQLKPSHEPICLAMKPLSEKNFAENIIKWGNGGLNIDGTRVGYISEKDKNSAGTHSNNGKRDGVYGDYNPITTGHDKGQEQGRYPANTIISQDFAPMLDKQSGILKSDGGASRFFKNIEQDENYSPIIYHAKSSKKDRNMSVNGEVLQCNNHTTVKPTGLMKYLLKMGLPPRDSVVLDMFAGSGSTGVALEQLNQETGMNHKCILMEMEDEHCEIIKKRCCV